MLFLEYIFCALHKAASKREKGGEREGERRARKRGMTPIMHRTSGEFVTARIVTECNNEEYRVPSPLSPTRVEIFKLSNVFPSGLRRGFHGG